MPREKNPEVDSREDLIQKLMSEVFEQRIFVPKNAKTIKDKAALLSSIGQEYNIKLAESELRNKFLTPFYKGQFIILSREYGANLSRLLLVISKSFKLEEFETEIELLAKKYELLALPAINVDANELFKKLYGNKQSLIGLVGSSWWVFERIGDHPIKDGVWGLAVGKLTFFLEKGFVVTEMIFRFDKTIRTYTGIASHDIKSDYIYIDQISSDETKRRSNLILRMADMDFNEQDTMLGHYSYHSKVYSRLISKTVLCLKLTDDEKSGKTLLEVGNYLNNERERYELIPLPIRSFLYNREKNRMSVPLKIVTNLDELDRLLEKRKGNLEHKIIREHIRGGYYVYYKKISGDIIENHLEIDYNSESVIVGCTFVHAADKRFDNKLNWKGNIFYNKLQNVMVLEMSNEKTIQDPLDEDPILLSFNLPEEDRSFSEVECYQGIIAGLGDGRTGAVSYKCLIISKKLPDFKRKDDPRIKKIFADNIPHLSSKKNAGFILEEFKFSGNDKI